LQDEEEVNDTLRELTAIANAHRQAAIGAIQQLEASVQQREAILQQAEEAMSL
jgi:hypothetical protein